MLSSCGPVFQEDGGFHRSCRGCHAHVALSVGGNAKRDGQSRILRDCAWNTSCSVYAELANGTACCIGCPCLRFSWFWLQPLGHAQIAAEEHHIGVSVTS